MSRLTTLSFVAALAATACSDDSPAAVGGAGGSSAPDTTSTSSAPSSGGGGSGASSVGGAGGAASGGGGEGEGGKLPTCDTYPSELTFPDNQAAVLAELETFAPDANLMWNSVHGTLSLVTNLGVPLDCAANGNDVWAAAWAFLSAHPGVFQLDESEWAMASPFPCSAVTSSNLVNTNREKLAGVDVKKDVLAIFVGPDGNGGVTLNSVSGFYLPVLEPSQIQDCEDLPDATLENQVRGQSYNFSTFNQCAPTGSGVYTPQPNDVVEWDGTWWSWEDGTGTVIAQKHRGGRLIIDEANWTDELMASDLNCPDETGDERILGYTLVVDPITGEVFAMPGIGCIVC
jgi:hypothetical protein